MYGARRIPSDRLIEYLAAADQRLYHHFTALPPEAPAPIPVSWAGDQQSPIWFDVAREYAEKWLHQQHIRAAVGRSQMVKRDWVKQVVLNLLDSALKYTPAGGSVRVQVAHEPDRVTCAMRDTKGVSSARG